MVEVQSFPQYYKILFWYRDTDDNGNEIFSIDGIHPQLKDVRDKCSMGVKFKDDIINNRATYTREYEFPAGEKSLLEDLPVFFKEIKEILENVGSPGEVSQEAP